MLTMKILSTAVVLLAGSYLATPPSWMSGGVVAMTQVLGSAPASTPVEIIDRGSWGARAGQGETLGQVDEVVVHHFWRPSINDVVPAEEESELMRKVEDLHVSNGWSGFGYNFVVFQSGRVYEGRGWGREGAHTQGKNAESVGIAFAVDGDRHDLTPEAWDAARRLVAQGVAEGHLASDLEVTGHTDHASKSCPGARIQPHIQQLVPRH